MNFYNNIASFTIIQLSTGILTVAVLCILLRNIFKIKKDTLSKINIEDKVIATPENKAIVEDQKDPTIWYDSDDALTRYKGEWKNGLPNGKGIKAFFGSRHPCVIEGNFVDGFANGHCVHRFEKTWEKTAPYYVGEFSQNQWHGFGEYHYGDYTYYRGEWRNGQSNGQGMEYSIILNQTWVGTFCNDKKGVGKWVDGKL
jgi:hypothetical protein